ncbi:hypothetical protein [Novosphingobium sp.]|uniref:hypothetical protein n=1 Tax=Novosphingobium sp. TaxID=1874826 RepID=UPI0025F37B4D|nr:hypothetical protein [Novosphingobium sp.]
MSAMRSLTLALLLLACAACSDGNRTAGGVSEGEADALDQAAEMLDGQNPPPVAPSAQPSPQPAATKPAG